MDQKPYQKFDRIVNAAMKANSPGTRIKLLKVAAQQRPKVAEETLDEALPVVVSGGLAVAKMAAKQALKKGATAAVQGGKQAAKGAVSKVQSARKFAGDVASVAGDPSDKKPEDQKKPATAKKSGDGLKKTTEFGKKAARRVAGGFASMYEPRESYEQAGELLSFSDFRQISATCRTNEAVDASKFGKTPDQLLQKIIDKNKLGGTVVKTGLQKANEGVGMAVAKAIGNPPALSKRMAVKKSLIVREIGKNAKKNKDKKYSGKAVHAEGAAWTKKSGQNPEGGLNENGRKSYEEENPGSDLKAPSKKVGNPRRSSFCARMKGMKKKLTSKKTANDPNSRINKSLRAWNC